MNWVLMLELLVGGNPGIDSFVTKFCLFLKNEMNAYSD